MQAQLLRSTFKGIKYGMLSSFFATSKSTPTFSPNNEELPAVESVDLLSQCSPLMR